MMKKMLFHILRKIWILTHTKRYKLIKKPDALFNIIHKVHEEQWVKMYIPEIYESSVEKIVEGKYPSENFYEIENAIVTTGSDVVLTPLGVWWDKFYDDDFVATALPFDTNVVSFTSSDIYISQKIHHKYIGGYTLSLLGVFSDAWSHFLFQFIPKLYFAKEAGILNKEINILVDKTNDNNIEQMIDGIIADYPQVKKIYAKRNTDYECEKLICIRSASSNYNEMRYWLDYRQLTPKNAINAIDKYLVEPLVDGVKSNITQHKKLFLPRRNNRFLNNNDEVEQFFKDQGFYFVEGKECSLEEKADLFYHADIIVGLHGAAWLNTIFCNKAKCLMLGNSRNIQEPTFYTLSHDKIDCWINVTGIDNDSDRRSNFYIPIEKIKSAYTELLRRD